MSSLDEDYQAWDAYPQHRWVFNKLEVALKLGYKAGPRVFLFLKQVILFSKQL